MTNDSHEFPRLRSRILESGHRLKDEALIYAERLREVSPDSALAFLKTFANAAKEQTSRRGFALRTQAEFDTWVRIGWEILDGSPVPPQLCCEYFAASAPFLTSDTFRYLEDWAELGLGMGEDSPGAAVEFFRSTPPFLESRKMPDIKPWARAAMRILGTGPLGDEAAIAYLRHSPRMHRFLSVMGFGEWEATGLLLAGHSGALASAYFALWPEALESLHQNDVRNLLDLAALIARRSPEEAIAFFRETPEILAGLNPNVREAVLKTVRKTASHRHEPIGAVFHATAAALGPLTNPAQERAMELEARIGQVSLDAAAAFLSSLQPLLSRIEEGFLPQWVDKGLSFADGDPRRAVDYFSLNAQEARDEASRWKEAVLLEDNKKILTLFAQALTGKEMRLRSTAEAPSGNGPAPHPSAGEGQTIHLPPWIAEEPAREANFRLYKVATAHHAGYVEFGTFDAGFPAIRALLESFPHPGLATDIFFLLEDGRIDRKLKQEYAGLAPEIDLALAGAIARRSFPDGDPLHQALEILLRLSAGFLDEENLSPEFAAHAHTLKKILAGFHQEARHIEDSFAKTAEVYQHLAALQAHGEYRAPTPLALWPRPDLDFAAGSSLPSDLPDDDAEQAQHGSSLVTVPLSKEELERLLENVKDLQFVKQLESEMRSEGLYVTGSGIEAADTAEAPQPGGPETRNRPIPIDGPRPADRNGPFYYDEWDYLQGDYRRRWCLLREEKVFPRESRRFEEIYEKYSDLIQKVKRQFRQIRPDVLDIVPRVDTGDELDLPALIQNVIDRRAGGEPSDRIFRRKERKIRRISTLLLIDMSASTDEDVPILETPDNPAPGAAPHRPSPQSKKIIDIEIEGLVVMTEALEALDDEYAIFGFSGQGRHKVDFYTIKEFSDPYNEDLKRRISGITPKQSTRMGPAIRHATEKLKAVEADYRLLIVLSDGFPQDTDYGEDRNSREYALNDTMMALLEARREGIRPFCLTVDQAGNDYLRKMCDPSGYLIIKDIHSLPEILPKVVESLMA